MVNDTPSSVKEPLPMPTWLGHPMIFNAADGGMGALNLPERTALAAETTA